MNFVFYLLIVVGLAIVAVVGYPIVSEMIHDIRGDLKDYYDEYEED